MTDANEPAEALSDALRAAHLPWLLERRPTAVDDVLAALAAAGWRLTDTPAPTVRIHWDEGTPQDHNGCLVALDGATVTCNCGLVMPTEAWVEHRSWDQEEAGRRRAPQG